MHTAFLPLVLSAGESADCQFLGGTMRFLPSTMEHESVKKGMPCAPYNTSDSASTHIFSPQNLIWCWGVFLEELLSLFLTA